MNIAPSTKVSTDQRHSASRPCPVCSGHERMRRGQGERCVGYVSAVEGLVFCSRRSDGAIKTVQTPTGDLYLHKLDGAIPRPVASRPKTDTSRPKPGYKTPADAARRLGTGLGKLTGSWTYPKADGFSCMVVHRFDQEDGEKTYRPIGLHPDGLWRIGDPPGPLPLYLLPGLANAATVIVAEGEKCVESLRSLGVVATTSAHGAGAARKTDWSPLADVGRVVLWPDSDEAGRGYEAEVLGQLAKLDPRPEVRVIRLTDVPPKFDAYDWIKAGGAREQLDTLVEEAELVDLSPSPAEAPNKVATLRLVAPAEADDRPVIVVSPEIHLVVEAAVQALESAPGLYQRGNELVTILRLPKGKAGRITYREAGSPQLSKIPVPKLAEMLSRSAKFMKYDGRSESYQQARVPSWCAETVVARGEWENIRPIDGVVEAPTIRPDGSILDTPGYDESTGLVYIPNGEFLPIPDRPTLADAQAAAARLLDLVADFPLKSKAHHVAWLSGLLTVVGRFAIPGPCPLFLVDGNVAGAGKSWLCDLIGIIVAMREMPRSSYRDDDTEMDKSILSIALSGARMILFDNVPTGFKIGGGAMDKALTGRTFRGRILGKTEMSPETPLDAVFFATGNNIGLKGDALRRIIPERLESPEERPEERTDFRIPDIKAHTREHRAEYLADALTILRAHAVAGRPASGLTPMSYPEWSSVIRDAVYWATGVDPAATRLGAREEDEDSQQRLALVQGWADLARIANSGKPVSAAQAIREVAEHPHQFPGLRDLFAMWSNDGKAPTPNKLGNILSGLRGRPTAAGSLDYKTVSGTRAWLVKAPAQADLGGPGGPGGPLSNLREKNCTESEKNGQSSGQIVWGTEPETGPLGPPGPPEPWFAATDIDDEADEDFIPF